MKEIKIAYSLTCHLWNTSNLTKEILKAALSIEKNYIDESHLIRRLLKCKDCGQLYFYEFYEEIDWKEGNDPQYRTWIPVEDIGSADSINALSVFELLKFPSIRCDWPSNQKAMKIYRNDS